MRHASNKTFRALFSTSFLALLVVTGSAFAEPWSSPTATAIEEGSVAAPPLAYLDFCERHVDQCGPDAQRIAANSPTVETGEDRLIPSSTGHVLATGLPFNWQLAFAAIPTSDKQPVVPSATQTATVKADASFRDMSEHSGSGAYSVPMTQNLWRQLENANTSVNEGVRSESDMAHYGVEDYWELPFEGGNGSGDCEDYVLQKRKFLISLGIPMNVLSVALVKTPWGEPHAVLLVRTNAGDYALDNLTPEIKSWDSLAYTWIKWQSRENPDVWVHPAL
jgi:predicted transglutaminase-like cysteine proteinase